MTTNEWSPQRAANRLVNIAQAYCTAHKLERFPVNVDQLALSAADIFHWDDPISKIESAKIKGFEGALFPGEDKKEWLLLYNDSLSSPGRILFTKAHELGHYILHRQLQESFYCSDADMLEWSNNSPNFEAQADLFASYLLMPLDDFRQQINANVDLALLGRCADRYGVSLTAAILKWLDCTQEKAVLILSTDGYMNWAWSSDAAFKAGAFFKTKNNVVELPAGSLATDLSIPNCREGAEIPATVWFKHADTTAPLCEMKIHSEQYGVMTLLKLPKYMDAWPPR